MSADSLQMLQLLKINEAVETMGFIIRMQNLWRCEQKNWLFVLWFVFFKGC